MAPTDNTASGSGTKAALRRGLARTARRVRYGRPVLSIVVLASGGDRAAQARLNATLSSVRDQPSPEIEIVVVTFDGGHDTALAAAGDAVVTGPTGTNVGDLVVATFGGRAREK